MSKLFDTPDKVNIGISAFRGLLNDPGWKLLVEIIDENIEFIRQQLEEGGENETIEVVNRLRDKLAVHKEIRNTPQNMIDKLSGTEDEVPESDPFPSAPEIIEERKRT